MAGDQGGLPLSVILSAANANDATMFEAVLDDIPTDSHAERAAAAPAGKVTPTRPTIIAAAVPTCAGVASNRGSPAA